MKLVLTSDLHRGFNEKTWILLDECFKAINQEEPEVVILAGDLGSNKFDHFKALLRQARQTLFPEIDIVAVRGNHDLWEKNFHDLARFLTKGSEEFKKSRIHHLEEGPFILNDVSIHGWDGWYFLPNVMTNDKFHVPGNDISMELLARRAHVQFQRVLDELDKSTASKKIVVSHMPCFERPGLNGHYNANPLYFEFLKGKCDMFCFGHTHSYFDKEIDGIRCINSGSDYNKPKYKVFEV